VVNGVRCEHEHDDGAYVLGALSPAERTAYERHLSTCSFCREAVRDISQLPDLLSRLDAKEFAKLLDPSLTADDPAINGRRAHPGASLRDMAVSSPPIVTRGKRRKNLSVRIVSSAAAVMLAAIIGVGVFAWTRSATPGAPPTGPAVAMTPVDGGSPVSATVRLSGTTGGTRVNLVCQYSKTADRPFTFRLIAYGPDEEQEQIGSWQASPGATFPMEGVTHFARGSLARLELVRFDGKAQLSYDVP
jgi:predicted anti-sigma-YlaC factor YlaD